ncbi:9989_t:CDS:2 [Diversispora eburnea]|uniref:9989_t:CDS:1 n=1 Tax=Diversispora eburnea TaxID=1213867 RepID=A0A9N8ZD36_9GLOM|nr:9989_t:CDS:2 [Diversispora eburnea]
MPEVQLSSPHRGKRADNPYEHLKQTMARMRRGENKNNMDIIINETPAKFSEKTINKARKVLKGYQELFDLLNRNVSLGESNTCILIGPTGCGKTVLLKKA